jgi:NADH-quinone oxidoreductase subunit A
VNVVFVSMLIPMAFYLAGIVLVLGVMYGVSYVLGERHRGRETHRPYESGIETTGSARANYSAQFYMVAILFVIFDLEVIFLFAWAVSAGASGTWGYIGMLTFALILIVGLIYEWRMGALDKLWRRRGRPLSRGGGQG